jgi:hypothetical protein
VRRPGGDGLSGAAAAGADRFWQEFSRARTERPRRGRSGAESEAPEQPAEEKADGHDCLEWCPICRSADVLRAAGGPEVRNQIASLQRDSLLALRTLIDAYLARSTPQAPMAWGEPPPGWGPEPGAEPQPGGEQPAEPPVQDIPLD